jgi:HK97 family phage prohead protease
MNKDKPQMEYKTFPSLALKFDEDQGIVEHIFTVFGVLDHVKDISHPGSFKKTLQERGHKVRVLDMHQADSIMRVVGKPLEIREVDRDELPKKVLDEYPDATGGVYAKTKFLIDTPEGKGAFIRLKEGAVDEWSYGYDALDYDDEKVKRNGKEEDVRNLRQIRLYEYGPVLWGANPATATLSAKSDDSPSESKPAPDVTENTIRIRVRDPDDFNPDAFGKGEKFRVINMGGEDSGIQATIGKLKGETETSIQSYIFDKEKFSVAQAQAWVDEHKKDGVPEDWEEKVVTEEDAGSVVPTEQNQDTYQCECIECGYAMESEQHCRDIKCPECGGEMRRIERPGPGKVDDDKAQWTTAYINTLPDSSFLYIAPGGEKDDEGKTTPRSLRFFPYKDVDGSIDLPHLRNAIARIPQSNAPGLTSAKKEALQERARQLLDEEQNKDDSGRPETKIDEPPEAVVFASVVLQDTLTKLEPDTWEYKAAELALSKLRGLYGDEVDTVELESKAGRVLAARNAQRIGQALAALISVLEDAGIDIPGVGKKPEPEMEEEEEPKDYSLEIETLEAELGLIELK